MAFGVRLGLWVTLAILEAMPGAARKHNGADGRQEKGLSRSSKGKNILDKTV